MARVGGQIAWCVQLAEKARKIAIAIYCERNSIVVGQAVGAARILKPAAAQHLADGDEAEKRTVHGDN